MLYKIGTNILDTRYLHDICIQTSNYSTHTTHTIYACTYIKFKFHSTHSMLLTYALTLKASLFPPPLLYSYFPPLEW